MSLPDFGSSAARRSVLHGGPFDGRPVSYDPDEVPDIYVKAGGGITSNFPSSGEPQEYYHAEQFGYEIPARPGVWHFWKEYHYAGHCH